MGFKRTIFLTFIITVCFLSLFNAEDQPLLCSQCKCVTLNDSSLEVTCSSDVTSTIFSPSNKSNTSTISKLTVRNNNFNNMTNHFPFENLTILDLTGNKIVHIADNIFKKLQKLEILILSYNNIEILQPNSFEGEYEAGDFYPLRSLRTILLDHNNLHSLNSDLFEHTEHVEQLSLSHNPLKMIDTHTAIAITNLVFLKNLDLSFTQISTLPSSFLHTPRNIEILNLSGNNFTEVPQELKEAHSLKTLLFNGNPMEKLTRANGFPKIPTLRILHLCQMPKLVSIGPGSLANLTNIEELFIAGNPLLTRIDDAAIATADNSGTYDIWPSIRKIFLNDNQLSYINRSLLARWDSLADLDLLNNPWTCECENQWMVETLLPIYLKIDQESAKKMKCAAPIEMSSFTFEELYNKSYQMRCLDYYGARPERDAALLVGMLAGLLTGIPIVLFCMYSYKRHWFGLFDDSPAAFSRQFYTKTNSVYEY
ncbi:hypothetical protein WA026_011249 [Henosepilachna vigintioctopunctata]|uniref:Uncharacterized protein n=1 Tax=Henosepilachna vigintioctopunctata TaxID=420089 RepID=A0AAW1TX13_9CUCU